MCTRMSTRIIIFYVKTSLKRINLKKLTLSDFVFVIHIYLKIIIPSFVSKLHPILSSLVNIQGPPNTFFV